MAWMCERCGCGSYHYNRARMRNECDLCGALLRDTQREAQLQQDDRDYAHACEHLCAGNWQQAVSLLQPLTERSPTDKKLYLAIVRAATRDFTDLDMDDPFLRSAAAGAWKKLVRLRGVSGGMLRYARACRARRERALRRRRSAALALLFAAAALSLLTGFFVSRSASACAFAAAALAVLCLCLLSKLRVFTLIGRPSAPPDDAAGPFVP